MNQWQVKGTNLYCLHGLVLISSRRMFICAFHSTDHFFVKSFALSRRLILSNRILPLDVSVLFLILVWVVSVLWGFCLTYGFAVHCKLDFRRCFARTPSHCTAVRFCVFKRQVFDRIDLCCEVLQLIARCNTDVQLAQSQNNHFVCSLHCCSASISPSASQ